MRCPISVGGQVSGAVMIVVAAALVGEAAPAAAACGGEGTTAPRPAPAFTAAPTLTTLFRLRGRLGEYLAPRPGHVHQGVDLIAVARRPDKALYRVMASGGGIVAFAGNSDPKGCGYMVIVDHRNGEYSLYAHLAPRASRRCVQIGDLVQIGQVLGYAYDPETGELSSGNARARTGVRPFERVQVHVELIHAVEGTLSKTGSAPIKSKGSTADPTPRLLEAGYSKD